MLKKLLPNSMRITDLSSEEIRKIIQGSDTLILPIGSIESNGPHMPVSQDFLVADEIANRLGQLSQTLVAPTIPWGVADALMSFPGTVSIRSRVLTDLVE